MATSYKQRITMAVIVLLGLLAGGAVLMTEKHKSGEAAEQAEGDGHAQEERAGAPAGKQTGAKSAEKTAGKPGAKDKHGHEEKPGIEAHEERQLKLTDEQTRAAGITVRAAGPGQLQAAVEFQGEIRFNEDRTTHVVPRLAGVTESVSANLGQVVKKGQVLAVIASTSLAEQRSEWLTAQKRRDAARVTYDREKKLWEDRISAQQDYLQAQSALQEADIAVQNASQKLAAVGATGASSALNRFEVRAPFAGTVVEKHLSLGEAVKEDASIFTVADLSTVWAEFAVAPKDLATVRVGQRATVSSTAFDGKVEGRIAYVGALIGEQSRTGRARVTLTNPQGAWRPGLYVTVSVYGENQEVPLVVSGEAVQTIENETMVFKAVPGGFVATPLKTGRSDGRTVEVLAGLKAGDKVASSKTFVLKSELGKGSAGHGH